MSTEAPVATEEPTEESNVEVSSTPEITKSAEVITHKVSHADTTATPVTKVPSKDKTVTSATKVPNTDTIVAPEIVESNTAGDVTVIATPVSTQVTEAPATTSQPVYNDEKNIEAVATPDVINPEKDNAFAATSETVADSTEKAGVTEGVVVEYVFGGILCALGICILLIFARREKHI